MDTKHDIFISKAVAEHGPRYDYSKVIYKNTHTKITIICKEHGEFDIRPMDHLHGYGCTKCSGKNQRLSQADAIKRIRSIHGDKYDLSLVDFRTINNKITLICPMHGEFSIQPRAIFQQHQGCKKCGNAMSADDRRKTLKEFIQDATFVHGEVYDYSRVKYTRSNIKVDIICRDHGVFQQTPSNHIHNKQGCPLCNTGKGMGGYTHKFFQHNPNEQTKPGILYAAVITNGNERSIKIGITAKTTDHRFGRCEYKNMDIQILHEMHTTLYDAFCKEQQLLQQLKDFRFYTNNDRFSGHTECLRVCAEVNQAIFSVFINMPSTIR